MRSKQLIQWAGQAGQALGLLSMGIGLGLMMAGMHIQAEIGIIGASRAGVGQLETWTYYAVGGLVVSFVVAFAAEWYDQQTEASEPETA